MVTGATEAVETTGEVEEGGTTVVVEEGEISIRETTTTIEGETTTTIRGDARDLHREATLRDLALAEPKTTLVSNFICQFMLKSKIKILSLLLLLPLPLLRSTFSAWEMDAGYASHGGDAQRG